MPPSGRVLNPAEAARRLGVSTKALRLYEERGLLNPVRTESGWRAYGPREMVLGTQIAALRALGFSLAQVGRVLKGDPEGLEAALAEHQVALEGRARELAGAVERVRNLRGELARGRAPGAGELARLAVPPAEPVVAFDLPWPWGGERFELRVIRPLNFIIGPLGSGKTRLARHLAEAIPGATFLGLDRRRGAGDSARPDPALRARAEAALAWMEEDGASPSDALLTLLLALEDGRGVLVIDMIEQGLDEATQLALGAWLRRRGTGGRPLFLLTRSSAILDLPEMGTEEAILFCPANHSPPFPVAPHPGAPGYEAVATCLAPPAVRARTEGMVAWRPGAVPGPGGGAVPRSA